MNIPPAILDLRIAPRDRKPIHVWLPLFLLWPLLLVLGVLALILTILADFVLIVLGEPFHRYTQLVARSYLALSHTRGMVVRIRNAEATVDMTVQ